MHVLGVKLSIDEVFNIFFERKTETKQQVKQQQKSVTSCDCNIELGDKFKFCPLCGSKLQQQVINSTHCTVHNEYYVNKFTGQRYNSYEYSPDLECELLTSEMTRNEFYASYGYFTDSELVKTIKSIGKGDIKYSTWYSNYHYDSIIIECISNASNIHIDGFTHFVKTLDEYNIDDNHITIYDVNDYTKNYIEDIEEM